MADISNKLKMLEDNVSRKFTELEEKIDLLLKNNPKRKQECFENIENFELLGNLPVSDDSSFLELNKKMADESHLRHMMVRIITIILLNLKSHVF